jgi:hypothetical protein
MTGSQGLRVEKSYRELQLAKIIVCVDAAHKDRPRQHYQHYKEGKHQ